MFAGWLILVGSIISARLNVSRIYAFGDSYTDFGNLFKLTQRMSPDPRYYFEGRASNGPTWIEIVARGLASQPKLTSFAFGGATSDNKQFTSQVPGAKQQVEEDFLEYHKNNLDEFNEHRISSLVTFAFGGNDLFLPGTDSRIVVSNLANAIRTLVTTYRIPMFTINVSIGVTFLPFTNALHETRQNEVFLASEFFSVAWKEQLTLLRKEFPKVHFYDIDYISFYKNLIQHSNPYTNQPWIEKDPCIIPIQSNSGEFTVCSQPQDYLYWDTIHPTQHHHQLIAEDTLRILNSDTLIESS